jgi:hypothetical protein
MRTKIELQIMITKCTEDALRARQLRDRSLEKKYVDKIKLCRMAIAYIDSLPSKSIRRYLETQIELLQGLNDKFNSIERYERWKKSLGSLANGLKESKLRSMYKKEFLIAERKKQVEAMKFVLGDKKVSKTKKSDSDATDEK